MKYTTISFERSNGTGVLTMNTPETLNTLSGQCIAELEHLLIELEAMDDIRVVIITGAGKAFVAGADIAYMAALTSDQSREFSAATSRLYARMANMKTIFIAAVNGFALGGGCELAMACDMRIASEKAKFGLPEVGLGILPGGGGTQRLARLVGMGKAAELIFTGDMISADEALAIGLVNRVVPAETLLDQAQTLAGKILKNAPHAVRYAKACLQQSQPGFEAGIAFESAMFGLCFSSPDQREGMQAFLEKRPAQFSKK